MRKILILGATESAVGEPPVWVAEHRGKLLIEQISEACAPLENSSSARAVVSTSPDETGGRVGV